MKIEYWFDSICFVILCNDLLLIEFDIIMHRSWDTDSEEESSLPEELYLKIKQRLGEANEIISADVKPDE